MRPFLVVETMHPIQAKILNAVAFCIDLRGGSVAYTNIEVERSKFEFVMEPSVNDVVKNNEEEEMNRQVDKETGE